MTGTLSHPRDFRRSVLGAALVAMATWWGFGLPYSLFSWLLDPMQLRWVLICYAWEVPVAGCLGPVLFPLLWFRAIERHWDHTFRDPGAVDPAKAAALEREILDFPLWVGFVFVVTSLAGYGAGAVQVRLFSQLPATEIFKIMALGLATGLVGGLFAFLYLESLLAPLLRRFGVLWAVVPPAGRRVPLHEKVFAGSVIITLTALVLLGTIFYSRGERVLEEQVGRRILAEAHHVAADLEQQGTARARDAIWWREQVAHMELGPSGYAYLARRDGTVVAGAGGPPRLDAEGFRPSVTHAILTGAGGVAVDRVYTPRIVAFVPLGDGGERILAVVYRGDFEGELDAMLHRGLVVFLASLVLALAQGILFSRRLTRPIEEVTGLASAIARAPGGPWEPVAVRTNDEVGELATAFNQMIARLEEARTGLERRVAAATRNIATLYEMARTTTSTLEIADVLELVAEKTLTALGLERLLVLWHPPELGDVVDVYAAAAGGPGERLEIAEPVDLAGLCPGTRPTLIATARLPAALADQLPAPRLLCLPLSSRTTSWAWSWPGSRPTAPRPTWSWRPRSRARLPRRSPTRACSRPCARRRASCGSSRISAPRRRRRACAPCRASCTTASGRCSPSSAWTSACSSVRPTWMRGRCGRGCATCAISSRASCTRCARCPRSCARPCSTSAWCRRCTGSSRSSPGAHGSRSACARRPRRPGSRRRSSSSSTAWRRRRSPTSPSTPGRGTWTSSWRCRTRTSRSTWPTTASASRSTASAAPPRSPA